LRNVAGQGERAAGVTDALAGGLGATGIARQQDDVRPGVGKDFGNRFPNAHGSPGHNHDFSVHLHGDSCIARKAASQTRASYQLSAFSYQ
jgi:hypothetical protein